MTNSTEPPAATSPPAEPDHGPWRETFYQTMQDLGVDKIHGVELLRLVKMTANSYDTITTEQMRTQHLSAPRWRMLLRLWIEEQHGCEALSPTQLSHVQKLSKNTVSAHLRSLEEQGLIERELDSDDLRQFRIRLSDTGRELVRCTTPGHMAFLNRLAAELTPAEIEMLLQLLQKLHGSLVHHAHVAMCKGEPAAVDEPTERL